MPQVEPPIAGGSIKTLMLVKAQTKEVFSFVAHLKFSKNQLHATSLSKLHFVITIFE